MPTGPPASPEWYEESLEELDPSNQTETRSLILAGLGERFGTIDPTRNPDLDDMLQSYRGGRTVVVRDRTGPVIGTGTVIPRPPVDGGPPTQAEILRMSVARSARRRGLGRRIVEELVATARTWEVDRVIVETSSDWTDAVEFYQRCGFTITGEDGDETWFERQVPA